MQNYFKWIIIGAIALITIGAITSFVSFSNTEIELRNTFTQKYSERTAFYDKMWKVLSQKSQIALKNDSSFQNNVNVIMAGRKDAPQVFMKWITESNPNANFNEVSILYQELSRAVEAQREGMLVQEKYMQDVVKQHSNLLQKFPGSFYNIFFSRSMLEYKPITSDRTDDVMKTGKDNDVKLF